MDPGFFCRIGSRSGICTHLHSGPDPFELRPDLQLLQDLKILYLGREELPDHVTATASNRYDKVGHAFNKVSVCFYELCLEKISDVDPHPVGSTFILVCGSGSANIWVRGFGSRGLKWKGKSEFNQQIFWGVFRRKFYISSLNLKK